MYQGKFSAGAKGGSHIYRLLEERNQNTSKTRPTPGKQPPARREPLQATPQSAAAVTAPAAVQSSPSRPRKTGTLVFWTSFCAFVFIFYCCTFLGLSALRSWLTRYELAQPTTKSQQVFQDWFAQPQWSRLYDLAQMEATQYEGKDAFCAYMEELVGGRELSMLETSAGLSGDRKYLIQLGSSSIASFTLQNRTPDEPLPDWQLGSVELFPEGRQEIHITMDAEATALVNGVPLTQDQIVSTGTLPVKDHVPTFARIPSLVTLKCTGLLSVPQVVIRDSAGTEREALYDPATNTFTQDGLDLEIPQELEDAAMDALKAYVVFMSTRGGSKDLAKHFDTTSDIYKELTSADRRWTQEGAISYDGESVTGYISYSADLFSAWVGLDLNITRDDGSVKTTRVEQTMFFTKNDRGSWICYDMSAQNLTNFQQRVKLTFRQDGVELTSGFYLADGSDLAFPLVSAPEGKALTGWMTRTQDASGAEVLKLMFTPDERGQVSLSQGTQLSSMVLEPLFE